MGMKVYRSGRVPGEERRRVSKGGFLRKALILLLVLFVLLLAYILLPFGGSRAVLLGSDARADEASRSDTIVVTKAGGGMLAVPRDTLVQIPDIGEDKINAAYANGGPELAVETLEGLTGVGISNYIVVDFGGVEEIVDALGGITVNVDEPIEYQLEGNYVSIPAGTQDLDGPEALAYVRYRGDASADIGRVGRQQQFLQALAAEVRSPSKLPKLPSTVRAVWRNIDTNMNPVQALRFAVRVGILGIGEAELYPGTPQYIDGISYWVPDEAAGEEVVARTVE
jgi:LCP family protein required for cell wall assembly